MPLKSVGFTRSRVDSQPGSHISCIFKGMTSFARKLPLFEFPKICNKWS